ncbi:MAG: filamentous hemagglutinin N-terminal domain-containing protein [Sedimentisphaerales bacterium]|nr:filamentous hemagglutinin N-terminal domain-containing protein [Sedimentisphaerales bacterium]
MKKLRRFSREYYFRQIMACCLVSFMVFGIPARVAMAAPANPVVPQGTIDAAGNTHNLGQNSNLYTTNGTIINWDTFNISDGPRESVTFHQYNTGATALSSDSAVLNRITTGGPSQILGDLNANGRVFIVNPAGIVFGSSATINVSQLVASGLDLANDDFLDGLPYEFTENPDFIGADDGIVTNESSDFQNAKRLYLIGRQVINRGHLVADECVIMAAGDTVLISENSPVSVQVEMGDGWSSGDDLYQVRNEDGDGIQVDGETAQVILAAGDIWSAALIKASSDGGSDAVATVDIVARGNVDIWENIIVDAEASGSDNATALVDIKGDTVTLWGSNPAGDGDIIVTAKTSSGSGDATASVRIDAEGDVISNNSGDIEVTATAGSSDNGDTSDALATLEIDAKGMAEADGDVIIEPFGDFDVAASTEDDEGSATATVDIDAAGDVEITGGKSDKDGILAEASGGLNNNAEIDIAAGGDLELLSGSCNETKITALAHDGGINNADVLICTDGEVTLVAEGISSKAKIEALAKCANSDNIATVGIGAKGEEGVEVKAGFGGKAAIEAVAEDGYTNTASTIVCTQGGVDVIAQLGGDAGILAQAKDGYFTDAYVGVCAIDDVLVQSGDVDKQGCHALIRTEAESQELCDQETTADAKTVVVSHNGCVDVLAFNGGHAGIEAEAQGAHNNTAEVGVAAGADLSPQVMVVPDYPNGDKISLVIDNLEILPETGNVLVKAYDNGTEAQILAWAHNAYPIYVPGDVEPEMVPGENTADTVVCAPGLVKVYAEDQGYEARIKSLAGWCGDEESINKATTQVYASEVDVDVSSLRYGQGIWAYAFGADENPHVPGEMLLDYLGEPYTDDYYCMTEHGEVAWTDGDAVLIIQDFGKRGDNCPDCPPCPCEEEELLAPVAPLAQFDIPRIEGCPGLMLAAASELGITAETLQIAIGNALALNPSLQPCQACASLVNAASVLRDEDGSRMAAMIQAFNTLAPADAPFTPEMATSIATAFEGAAEGTQYASLMEYIDAFVQYVTILDANLGSPVGDSMAFVMEKYGTGAMDSDNANITAFLTTRIEGSEAFGD